MCALCRRGLRPFESVYSYGSYDGTLRKLIQLFKYSKVQTLSKPLSRLMASAIPLSEEIDLVVPMPMHWRKRWQRGFNQAELLAGPIAARFGTKITPVLRRNKATQAQAGLSGVERRKNVKHAFVVARPERVRGKRVLLIDDVYTTGTTAGAAAAALRSAGAARVIVLTLARVDRREGLLYRDNELVTESYA